MSDQNCTACGQDLRLPPIDIKEWRAILALVRAVDRDLPAHARLDAIDRARARLAKGTR